MKRFLSRITKGVSKDDINELEAEEEYVELDTADNDGMSKILVRPFTIEDFSDIKPILDVLRDGSTIALINIRPLKDKDLIELKRAVNKLKNTCDAIDGDIAGFGDDYMVITPSFAHIYRGGGEAKDLRD
jgi:SepF-like predicted cell division protein (DUF552 family)